MHEVRRKPDALFLEEMTSLIVDRIREKPNPVIAVDGDIAAGKSTLSKKLKEQLEKKGFRVEIISMDDYYLPISQIRIPFEGNCDLERIAAEVLLPFKNQGSFSTARFDPVKQELEPFRQSNCTLLILEGNYSLHPELSAWIDLSFFLDIDKESQKERLQKRNPEKIDLFQNLWIPQSEEYFNHYKIFETADYCLQYNNEQERFYEKDRL